MNGPPADVPPIWIALLVVSASVLGVVIALPSAPPPDATRVADAVDSVAATEHAGTATAPLSADAIRVGRHGIGLRNEGGEAHASFAFGPVTPVRSDSDLAAVLTGAPPQSVFATPTAYRDALERARTAEPTWEPVDDRLRVRRVQYGGVEGVLVGQ